MSIWLSISPRIYRWVLYALEFVGKKAVMLPLGLLTVAAMFPEHDWHVNVVDMNVEPLTDAHLAWADYVFTSTMIVQKQSFYEVVKRCNQRHIPVIAGGPHPTSYQAEIQQEAGGIVSHILSGEVEHIFQDFLLDLRHGTASEVYEGPRTARGVQTDITQTPQVGAASAVLSSARPRLSLVFMARAAALSSHVGACRAYGHHGLSF